MKKYNLDIKLSTNLIHPAAPVAQSCYKVRTLFLHGTRCDYKEIWDTSAACDCFQLPCTWRVIYTVELRLLTVAGPSPRRSERWCMWQLDHPSQSCICVFFSNQPGLFLEPMVFLNWMRAKGWNETIMLLLGRQMISVKSVFETFERSNIYMCGGTDTYTRNLQQTQKNPNTGELLLCAVWVRHLPEQTTQTKQTGLQRRTYPWL